MASWRDTILKNFKKGIARLTLVSDPDGLLTEEGMLNAIRERGFDLIPFQDHVAFRYAYESRYRQAWDEGRDTDLVVALHSDKDLEQLPYDLLHAGRKLRFALHQLFPKLSYPVVESLDRSYLDALYEAYQKYDGSTLGDRATKEFILVHCFRIVPTLITTPVDLMKLLLSRHYRKVHIPAAMDDLLLETLRAKPVFADWPLEQILASRENFLRFLQDQWPVYLESLCNASQPCPVPFGHEDIRVYIDNLFLEGLLTPVEQDEADRLPAWVRVGVVHDPHAQAVRRVRRLLERFETELPGPDAPYRDWQRIAPTWAELVMLRWEQDDALEQQDRDTWSRLQGRVEQVFGDWMLGRYGPLSNVPFLPQPVMVHHIARYLAAQRGQGKFEKVALIVVDGLALDQWTILRHALESQQPCWRFEESCLFGWVPTLTSISRQAIFAAEPPLYFPDSLGTTAKEPSHWTRFWEDQGLPRGAAEYIKGIESANAADLEDCLENPQLAVLGLIVNKVDDILHGTQLGTAGMHSQVRLWAAQGHLAGIIARLHAEGFAVFVTADHGNVTAEGMGTPKEGVLVEVAGSRARIYEQQAVRDEARAKFPDTTEWPGAGLPPDRYVLLPRGLKSFSSEGQKVTTHGGIALEEVMVPFVRIDRNNHGEQSRI